MDARTVGAALPTAPVLRQDGVTSADISALLARCAVGDRDAVANVYDMSHAVAHGMALSVLDDESAAIEVLHLVYAEALVEEHRLEEATVPGLIHLAHRVIVDHARSSGPRAVAPFWLNTRVHDQPDVQVARRRIDPDLAGRLEPTEEQALTLAFLDGHTVTETAAGLGIHRLRVLGPLRSGLRALAADRVTATETPYGTYAHTSICDWVGAWAVNAVDRFERPRFEEHLAGCERCQEESHVLLDGMARMAVRAAVPAPAEVREDVLRAIERPAVVDVEAVARVPRQRRFALPRLRPHARD